MAKKRRAAPKARARHEPERNEPPVRTPDPLTRRLLEALMFGSGSVRRFTQDSPVLPDVWLEYAGAAGDDSDGRPSRPTFPFPSVKLLLTPYRENAAGDVRTELVDRLGKMRTSSDVALAFGRNYKSSEAEGSQPKYPRVAYNLTTVAAKLHFEELVRVVLPMSDWWAQHCETLGIGGGADNPVLENALIAGVPDPEHADRIKA